MSVGFGEVLVVLVIALVVLGPKRLPETARALGRALRELRESAGETRFGAQQYLWEDRLEHEADRPADVDRGEEAMPGADPPPPARSGGRDNPEP